MQETGWPDALPRPGNRRFKQLDSIVPWFEIYQVGHGTFALLEPRHREEVIAYLILGSVRAVLFDTGMGIGNIRAEVRQLTDLPVVVVNSHGHYDHVGDNYRFAEVWAFDHDGEVARIEGGLTCAQCAHYLAPGSYLDLPPGFDPASYEIRPAQVTRRLHHLERIELGQRTLEVHHTPGHSPGSICLLDSVDALLFTGDTFYPGVLYGHFSDSDLAAYRQSLQHLLSLLDRVSHLCPAHNEAYAPKEVLTRTASALDQVATGQVPFQVQDGVRIYDFGEFGLTLPDQGA
jgi:glyoxylase-like metal-dependent hydrolase (beta-lactamase superfamily II)